MEYTVKRPFRYRSRMMTAGDVIDMPRAFGAILLAKGKVTPGRPVPAAQKVRKPVIPSVEEVLSAEVVDDMKALRAEYRKAFGKGPGPSWDAATIREKIAGA